MRVRNAVIVSSAAMIGSVPAAFAGQTNNIMITGYWPPTNEMIRQFSTDPVKNPGGWIGSNWENSGFNVHSFFPETPAGSLPWGTGDFEVDYQDTSADWDRITAEIKPVAIITFSRASTAREWQMEPAYQRFRNPGEAHPPGRTVPQYSSDQRDTLYPTNVPMTAQAVGTIRNSTLPMQQIVNAVEAVYPSNSVIDPHIANYNPKNPDAFDFGGAYLSGYIGYHGAWYYDEHSAPDTPFRTFAAGHIHVGTSINLAVAQDATKISLRTLIDYIRPLLPTAGDANIDGTVNLADYNILAANYGTPGGAVWENADFTYDGIVNLADYNLLAGNYGLGAAGPGVTPGDWATLAAAIPEPAASGAAGLVLTALASTRRRRA